jgi:hypothetical protein
VTVRLLAEQTLYLPPRTTSFRAVCEACQDQQLASRGYLGATIDGTLPLEVARGHVECERGHRIRVVRATPDAALR